MIPKIPRSPAEAKAMIENNLAEIDKMEQKSNPDFFKSLGDLMALGESLRKEASTIRRQVTFNDEGLRAIATTPDAPDLLKRQAHQTVAAADAVIALASRFESTAEHLDQIVTELRELRRNELDRFRDLGMEAHKLLTSLEMVSKKSA